MKPCNQVLAYGPNFHGRVLPLYALYGNVNSKFYYCSKLFPNKDHFYTIFIYNGYRWEKTSTKEHKDIAHFMASYMRLSSFVRHQCIPSKRYHKTTEQFIKANAPKERKHPQPLCDNYSGCYSQSMVDGNGYNITSEEYNHELHNYSGIPVEYKRNRPVIGRYQGFNKFDGVGLERRDGMKIDQTKIRPEKSSTREKPTKATRISITGEITVINLA